MSRWLYSDCESAYPAVMCSSASSTVTMDDGDVVQTADFTLYRQIFAPCWAVLFIFTCVCYFIVRRHEKRYQRNNRQTSPMYALLILFAFFRLLPFGLSLISSINLDQLFYNVCFVLALSALFSAFNLLIFKWTKTIQQMNSLNEMYEQHQQQTKQQQQQQKQQQPQNVQQRTPTRNKNIHQRTGSGFTKTILSSSPPESAVSVDEQDDSIDGANPATENLANGANGAHSNGKLVRVEEPEPIIYNRSPRFAANNSAPTTSTAPSAEWAGGAAFSSFPALSRPLYPSNYPNSDPASAARWSDFHSGKFLSRLRMFCFVFSLLNSIIIIAARMTAVLIEDNWREPAEIAEDSTLACAVFVPTILFVLQSRRLYNLLHQSLILAHEAEDEKKRKVAAREVERQRLLMVANGQTNGLDHRGQFEEEDEQVDERDDEDDFLLMKVRLLRRLAIVSAIIVFGALLITVSLVSVQLVGYDIVWPYVFRGEELFISAAVPMLFMPQQSRTRREAQRRIRASSSRPQSVSTFGQRSPARKVNVQQNSSSSSSSSSGSHHRPPSPGGSYGSMGGAVASPRMSWPVSHSPALASSYAPASSPTRDTAPQALNNNANVMSSSMPEQPNLLVKDRKRGHAHVLAHANHSPVLSAHHPISPLQPNHVPPMNNSAAGAIHSDPHQLLPSPKTDHYLTELDHNASVFATAAVVSSGSTGNGSASVYPIPPHPNPPSQLGYRSAAARSPSPAYHAVTVANLQNAVNGQVVLSSSAGLVQSSALSQQLFPPLQNQSSVDDHATTIDRRSATPLDHAILGGANVGSASDDDMDDDVDYEHQASPLTPSDSLNDPSLTGDL